MTKNNTFTIKTLLPPHKKPPTPPPLPLSDSVFAVVPVYTSEKSEKSCLPPPLDLLSDLIPCHSNEESSSLEAAYGDVFGIHEELCGDVLCGDDLCADDPCGDDLCGNDFNGNMNEDILNILLKEPHPSLEVQSVPSSEVVAQPIDLLPTVPDTTEELSVSLLPVPDGDAMDFVCSDSEPESELPLLVPEHIKRQAEEHAKSLLASESKLRKPKPVVPETKRDEAYYNKRMRNNVSAAKNRAKTREMRAERELKHGSVMRLNASLLAEVSTLEAELKVLKARALVKRRMLSN